MTEKRAEPSTQTSDSKEPSHVLRPPAVKADEGTIMDPEINLRDRSGKKDDESEEG